MKGADDAQDERFSCKTAFPLYLHGTLSTHVAVPHLFLTQVGQHSFVSAIVSHNAPSTSSCSYTGSLYTVVPTLQMIRALLADDACVLLPQAMHVVLAALWWLERGVRRQPSFT